MPGTVWQPSQGSGPKAPSLSGRKGQQLLQGPDHQQWDAPHPESAPYVSLAGYLHKGRSTSWGALGTGLGTPTPSLQASTLEGFCTLQFRGHSGHWAQKWAGEPARGLCRAQALSWHGQTVHSPHSPAGGVLELENLDLLLGSGPSHMAAVLGPCCLPLTCSRGEVACRYPDVCHSQTAGRSV